MKDTKKVFLACVGLLFLLMLMFPPFLIDGSITNSNKGYAFIFSPPSWNSNVNVGLLFVQWLFLAAIGFIGWYLLKDKKSH